MGIGFTLPLPIEKSCFVRITFPSDIKLNVDEVVSNFLGTGFMVGTLLDGSIVTSSVIVKNYGSGNSVTFPAC